MNALTSYSKLISNFLDGNLSAVQFSDRFVQRFKSDSGPMSEELFLLLDELFGDAESFTLNPALLREKPGFYLDEPGLQAKARDILERMRNACGQQVAA